MVLTIYPVVNSFSSKLTIVCATTIVATIGLALLPEVFAQIKGENNVNYENLTILVVVFTQIGNNFGYLHGLHFSAW
jgi:hypothetical protein